MDGANMNAQVGLTSPAAIGADVCHLNLHKTFASRTAAAVPAWARSAWPRTWRRICPVIRWSQTGGDAARFTRSPAAPWGSASILLISYGYIRMLGGDGLTDATRYAILNANYIKARLEPHYPVLYTARRTAASRTR